MTRRETSPLKAPRPPGLDTLRLYANGAPPIRDLEPPTIRMAPGGLPDWEDLGRTTFDPSPFALEQEREEPEELTPVVSYGSSHVRVVAREEIPFDAMRVLDAIGEAQLQLTLDIFCLESAANVATYDPSARAASDTLRARIQELCDLRDALNEVYLEANTGRASQLFMPGRPFAAYVRGLHVWSCAVVASLTKVAGGLRALTPDWHEFRKELESASAWFFDGLVADVREDLLRSDVPELGERAEELFWAAQLAQRGLEKRFG
jgi:hypothetical protein